MTGTVPRRAGGVVLPVLLIWLPTTTFAALNLAVLPPRARTAIVMFIAGMTMNTLAIAANRGMPFSVGAARRAGLTEAQINVSVPGHPPLTTGSRLAPLADVLPVPGVHAVASVGSCSSAAG